MESHRNLPQNSSSLFAGEGEKRVQLPRLLPMDRRGPAPLEENRDHREDGGGGAAHGALPADDFGRENVRGEFQRGVPVARLVHAVGVRAADEEVWWKIARFGADVRLQRSAGGESGEICGGGSGSAAALQVLRG